jgi:ATP-dependent Clp protease ATP-binding subunit ClpA
MSNFVNEKDAVKFIVQFTSFIASNPKGIILFDDMDKADPKVFDFLLHVFDEGEITGISNRKLECKEAVFVMTGNVGLTTIMQFRNQVPKIRNIFESDEGEAELNEFRCKFQDSIRQELRSLFHKDFIYRINEVIPFFDFTKDNVLELYKQELEKGYKVFSFDDLVVSWIVQHYHQDDKGAASVHDTVQNIIYEKIARIMIRNPKVTKLHLSVDHKTNKLLVSPVEFGTEKRLRSKL